MLKKELAYHALIAKQGHMEKVLAVEKPCHSVISDDGPSEDDEQFSDDGGIDMAEDAGSEGVTSVRPMSTPDRLHFISPRIDSYRFSMANLEDSQEVELDAILGELCALESRFDQELLHRKGHQRSASFGSQNSSGVPLSYYSSHNRSYSGGLRTDSPDNDSAFSDNISMLSSESSASSGITRTDISAHSFSSKSSGISVTSGFTQLSPTVNHRLQTMQCELDKENLPLAEQAARIKAEKIKIALEKLREANVKKLFIKTYTADGSAKSLLVDEKMTCGYVAKLLADKNHTKMDPKWVIVEHVSDLFLERFYEDHEYLVENLLLWTRDSKNRLLFVERPEKYNLFSCPEGYLLAGNTGQNIELDDEARTTLIEDFFSGNGVKVPEVEGMLYLKSDGKKAWKKHFFVLRASGLYYCPKGKSKLPRDLMCLTTFDANQVYFGIGWKKKYKAPTDFGFAIKHPQIQTKSSKYMKFLCAEDEETLKQWVMGARLAKHGRQLQQNYKSLLQDIAEDDLELLAKARSCSMAVMPHTMQRISPTTPERFSSQDNHLINLSSEVSTPLAALEKAWRTRTLSRQNSIRSNSSSSGCLSDQSKLKANSIIEVAGFESDFPTGTIKRKPSMMPKIPLTSTTRNLAKQSVTEESIPNASAFTHELCSKIRNSRNNLRRSLTDERISLGNMTFPSRKFFLCEKNHLSSTEKRDADIDNLPLPPPPMELGLSLESLLNKESFPPPPPEAFQVSSSMKAIPSCLSEYNNNNNNVNHFSSPKPDRTVKYPTLPLNLLSLPLKSIDGNDAKSPVAPIPPPKPGQKYHTWKGPETDSGSKMSCPFLAKLKSPPFCSGMLRKPSQYKGLADMFSATLARTSANSVEEPTANSTTQLIQDAVELSSQLSPPPPPPPPPLPSPPSMKHELKLKPLPPKRSNSTKLTAGNTSSNGSQITPPKTFLADLHRVMEKKWKIAQQLSQDFTDLHEVMGFREPVYVNNTSYSTYENISAFDQLLPPPPPPPPLPAFSVCSNTQSWHVLSPTSDTQLGIGAKRKPPPRPPKRSETTHLTTKADDF